MATPLAASTQLRFLCPRSPLLRFQFHNHSCRCFQAGSNRISAKQVREEESSSNVMDDYNWNENGSGFEYNESVEASNGSLKRVLNGNGASNGSLVKYVNGNGAAAAAKMPEKMKRKKTVEEIGQGEEVKSVTVG